MKDLLSYVQSAFSTCVLRQNSSREDGWIESKIGDKGEWIRRWFIFDDGVLKYGGNSLDSDNELTKIPMDRVMSLRADVRIALVFVWSV